MRDIIIKMTVTEEDDLDVIVTPGNEEPFGQLVDVLEEVTKTVIGNRRALSELAAQIGMVEHTKGGPEAVKFAKQTIVPMIERNRIAEEQMLYVRMLLSKSRRAQYETQAEDVRGPLQ